MKQSRQSRSILYTAPTRHTTHYLWYTLPFLFVLLIVGVFIYFSDPEVDEISYPSTRTKQPAKILTQVQKYTNSKELFSFTYPKNWRITADDLSFTLSSASATVAFGQLIKTSYDPVSYWKRVGYLQLHVTPWEFLTQFNQTYESIKITGRTAIHIHIEPRSSKFSAPPDVYLIPVSSKLLVMQSKDETQISPVLSSLTIDKMYQVPTHFHPKQYVPNKDVTQRNTWPFSIPDMSDASLVSMSCNQYQTVDGQMSYHDPITGDVIDISHVERARDIYEKIQNSVENKHVSAFTACQTVTGKTYLEYEVPVTPQKLDTTPPNNDIIFADITDNRLNQISYIHPTYNNAWSCSRALQLTKSGMMYFLCGGGDGYWPTSDLVIYELDLNAQVTSPIKHCSWIWEKSPEDTHIVCDW